MRLNYLAWAVPLFVFFMLLEYWIAKRRGKSYFNFVRSVTNINVGIAERLLDVLVTGAFYFVYDYLYRHFALFHFKPNVFHWALLLLATDFLWYWYHRLAHEINLFWMVHVVHHQSEDFNYTVSARITVFQAVVRTGFWSVLPVLGFTAPMITTVLLVHGLYPFFIHTRLIGKLGILEYILVTPSHHRVHHASNPCYLDKNYGDMLIIWDKLFGTFCEEKEEEPVVYGLTHPLQSHSFLWQHFHFVLELVYALRKTQGWGERFRLLFGRPDRVPAEARAVMERKLGIRSVGRREDDRLNRYVVWQVALMLPVLFLFILLEHELPLAAQWLAAALIIITLINCGAIMEQRRWIFYLEYSRYVLLLALLLIYMPAVKILLGLLLVAAIPAFFFRLLEGVYLQRVYRGGVVNSE
jgi:sterol desaturase/sphingolipid hydroxylase (fatty acid hydroxylase superfamily)